MKLSPADLVTIQEGAATLEERLSGRFVPKEDPRGAGERRLALWKQATRTEDLSRLASAMGTRCTTNPVLPALLGPVRLREGAGLPPWAAFVAEIVEATAGTFGRAEEPFAGRPSRGGPMTRIPFWQLYRPIAQLACSRVADRNSGGADLLTDRAWEDLQCLLMHRISAVVSTALHTKFLAHRAFLASGMASLFSEHDRSHESHAPLVEDQPHYARFIREEGCDGLRLFFLRYPVAARLVAEATQNWMDAAQEFLERFEDDREELSERFNDGSPLARIVRVDGGLSDPHHDGRTVWVVTFGHGLRLVYKPRSLRTDVLYYDLLRQLNASSPKVPLRTLTVLDRSRYGWVEFVSPAPCASKAAARRFYHRAGSLVALSHWLQAIDLHRENLVAAGEQPVIIDLETLLHPFSLEEAAFAREYGTESLTISPVRSGLLPLWQAPFGQGVYHDNSALGAPISKRALLPSVRWRHLDTDQITWKQAVAMRHHRLHRPRLGNSLLVPGAFSTDIERGYQTMAALLGGSGKAIFDRHRESIAATTRRRVKRPTPVYTLLLRQSLLPERLASGIVRSIGLQALPCNPGDEAEWAVEIASLECLDVPYFTVTGASHGGGNLPRPSFGQPLDTGLARQIRHSVKGRLMLQNGRLRTL